MIGGTYLHPDLEAHRDNLALLGRIGSIIQASDLPFILFGDMNMPPEAFEKIGFHARLRARIVATDSNTCRQGRGSKIDYAIVSDSLCCLLDDLHTVEAPFGPHLALRLRLRAPDASQHKLVQDMGDRVPREVSGRSFAVRSIIGNGSTSPQLEERVGSGR